MRGVNAAVVGLLGAALYNPVWTSSVKTPGDFGIALVGFVLLTVWRAPPLVVVIIDALGGIALAQGHGRMRGPCPARRPNDFDSCLSVGDREARANCQCGELIDRVAPGDVFDERTQGAKAARPKVLIGDEFSCVKPRTVRPGVALVARREPDRAGGARFKDRCRGAVEFHARAK
jgi:hypothetical protein